MKKEILVSIFLMLFTTLLDAGSVNISNPTINLGETTTLEAIEYNSSDSFVWKGGIGYQEIFADEDIFYFEPEIAGKYTFELIVNGKSEYNVSVKVNPNPLQTHIEAGDDKTLCLGDEIKLKATAPANSDLEWKIEDDKYADGPVFYFNPTATGVYNIDLFGNNEKDSLVVTVNNCGGSRPSVNAGEDKIVTVGDTVTITGTGTGISYEWKEGTDVLATTLAFDYTSALVGVHTLRLTATDNNGVTQSDEMRVTVNEENNSSGETSTTQEIALCQNKSAYISTLYSLGMSIDSNTTKGTVLSKGNNFVGAVVCGQFTNATSSTDVLTLIKNSAFPNATNIILNNINGSLKAQYEVTGANRQAYAQLKSILTAMGESDFSNYIDYSNITPIQDLYIDIFIKYVDAKTVYIVVTVTDKNDNNINSLNSLVTEGVIAPSNTENTNSDTFIYSGDRLKVDILFVMDDSGSMREEQKATVQAITRTFGLAMSSKNVDWKATVVGTGYNTDYSHRYIDNPSENNITKLASQLELGTNGSGSEYGLLKAYNYLTNGNMSSRSDSALVIVYISDEICHSNLNQLGISNIADSYFVKNNVKVNTIIPLTGEYTYASSTRANDLAYLMANATGGEVANLHNYATGYDAMMQKIADNSAGSASVIVLTKTPIIASIQVSVNGVVVANSGWSYNSSNNSIVFNSNSTPNSGDNINITYNY